MVARVLLSGYEHTRAGVISREVGIRAGEPMSESAIVETQRKLYNLGIFSRVAVAPQNAEGDTTDKTVVVMVDEAKRYTFAYGLGFEVQRLASGATGNTLSASPRITLELTKANLTGRADSLSFKVRASTIQGRGLLTYTAPNYFSSENFTLQLSAYYDKTHDIQTFDSRRAEGSIQLTQRLSATSSLVYRYAYRKVETILNPAAAITNAEQLPLFDQNTNIAEFGVTWLRDRRNSPSDPTQGDFETVDVDLAMKAIGSDTNFVHVYLQNSTYYPDRPPLRICALDAIRSTDALRGLCFLGYSSSGAVLRRWRHITARVWPQPGRTSRSLLPDSRLAGRPCWFSIRTCAFRCTCP